MSLQTICPEKKDIDNQDITAISSLVEKLMKDVEALREENAILREKDNPKRKAIMSDSESEGSFDQPIKIKPNVKKIYESSYFRGS